MIYDLIDFSKGSDYLQKKTYLNIDTVIDVNNIIDGEYQNSGVAFHGHFSSFQYPFSIELVVRKMVDNTIDWENLFSFGTHATYSDDTMTSPMIKLYGYPFNNSLYLPSYISDWSDFVKNKHIYTIDVPNENEFSYYIDNDLYLTTNSKIQSKYFYIGGAGFRTAYLYSIQSICLKRKDIYKIYDQNTEQYSY